MRHRRRVIEVLDLLDALVATSLVEVDLAGTTVGYRQLETVRQYAAEQLSDLGRDAVEAARDAHGRYFRELAESAAVQLDGAQQASTLQHVDLEYPNLLAALAYLLERPDGGPSALLLAISLRPYWQYHNATSEGIRVLELALERPDNQAASKARGQGLDAVGYFYYQRNEYSAALTRYEDGLAIARALPD